jgi:hypothetical protein
VLLFFLYAELLGAGFQFHKNHAGLNLSAQLEVALGYATGNLRLYEVCGLRYFHPGLVRACVHADVCEKHPGYPAHSQGERNPKQQRLFPHSIPGELMIGRGERVKIHLGSS